MPHITEDGRCSWCGWGGPDWDECEALSWHWDTTPEDVYAYRWRLHLEAHKGEMPLPTAEEVLAEARAVLWLSGPVR